MRALRISLLLVAAVSIMTAASAKPSRPAPRKAASLTPAGDPLAGVHRAVGETRIDCNAALETVMLIAGLAVKAPEPTAFQAQVCSRFALFSNHPAVVETASLMAHGFGYRELARFSTFLSSAPNFVLNESDELKDLAGLLPPASDPKFNMDRLAGYSRLVREFYWDTHVGRFLRESTAHYQQALRGLSVSDFSPDAKVLFSPLAPVTADGRLAFTRQTPRPVDYIVLGRNQQN